MQRTCAWLLVASGVLGAAGCITTSPKLALRWPGDLKREQIERTLNLARLNERQGKYNDALSMYQQVLNNDEKNVTAHHRLGAIAVKEGRLDEGRQAFELAASLGKPSAELLNDMGYVLYLQQDLPNAEARLRAAVQADSRYKNAHNNLGLVLAEQGRFDEALVEFKLVGSDAEAYSNLAFIQTKLGDLADAERNYHKALSLDNSLRPAAEALLQIAHLKAKATGTPPPGMVARAPGGMGNVRQAGGSTESIVESVQPAIPGASRQPSPPPPPSPPPGAPGSVIPTSGTDGGDQSAFSQARFDPFLWVGDAPPLGSRGEGQLPGPSTMSPLGASRSIRSYDDRPATSSAAFPESTIPRAAAPTFVMPPPPTHLMPLPAATMAPQR